MDRTLNDLLANMDSGEVLTQQLLGGARGPSSRKVRTNREQVKIKPQRRGAASIKLTDHDVLLVRQLWVAGEPMRSIAQKFEVSPATIKSILVRRRRAGVR